MTVAPHPTSASPAYDLDSLHQEFQTATRAFVRRHLLPRVDEAEALGTLPADLWPLLGQQGLLGIGYPEELGGSGEADTLAVALLCEELAKTSGGITASITASAYMAAPHLAKYGTPEQQRRYLEPLIAGRAVASIAVSEPGAGSDVAAMRTVARQVEGGYQLSGTKLFITNGGVADTLIVAAKTDTAAGHRGITTFIVEKGDPGFTVGKALHKMGWRSSDTRELIFDDCFVPSERVLGEPGRGFYAVMNAFQTERVVLAGMGVGLAQAALDDAVAHAKLRETFGQPIGRHQAIRHKLAGMAVRTQTARLFTYAAAAKLDAGSPDALDFVAMAKYEAARAANDVADDAVQIFGGYGYTDEYRVSLHYRDARILRIGGGSDEIMLEVIAKRLGL